MKKQALFSSTDKSKKLKCRLLQILFGALRVKWRFQIDLYLVYQKLALSPQDKLFYLQLILPSSFSYKC